LSAADPARKTVLVIEDNTIAREGLVVVLRRHGFDAITATDGGAALDMLAGGASPDLILLDMLMPGTDGWRFLDRFRAGRHGPIPVIITTGTNLTREWADSHHCAGFLKKPYDAVDLVAEIRQALGLE
jgi:two-component system response regulator MtrA